jgi:hypothetical protein
MCSTTGPQKLGLFAPPLWINQHTTPVDAPPLHMLAGFAFGR